TVAVRNPRKVGVPNAFSPNGDGINDVWRPINLEDYPGSELSIWNRWGNRIFHSFGPNKADYTWDGKFNSQLQPQEVY
ncbi:gliding motility-associated C-terminal domain-containing protein, partial [Streptomyces scabiei]|uniref:T9SS type B sorting domain-containing protein n=1 Tax=Streptomyces scabiei TaxID=1930 RepID=UPI0038F73743